VNVSGTTNHAVQVGNGTGSLTSLSVGATGSVLLGATGADPAFTVNPTILGNVTVNNLLLPATTASNALGTIFLGGDRFAYAYPDSSSVFLGSDVGNATTNNGTNNVVIGSGAAPIITDPSGMVVIGHEAGSLVLGAADCVVIGKSASVADNAQQCIVIGSFAGADNTTGLNSNIYIGSPGVLGENNTTRIGNAAAQCFIGGIDSVSVGSVAEVVTVSSDQLGSATLTAGSNITITPSAGAITIATTGGGVTWEQPTESITMEINHGYWVSAEGDPIELSFPATANFGDQIEIFSLTTSPNIFRILAPTAGIIILGNQTVSGPTGYLQSQEIGDALILRAYDDNQWFAISAVGNWTVV